MRQFFYSIPDEIIESARIDGANEFQIFIKIAVPAASILLWSFSFTMGLESTFMAFNYNIFTRNENSTTINCFFGVYFLHILNN